MKMQIKAVQDEIDCCLRLLNLEEVGEAYSSKGSAALSYRRGTECKEDVEKVQKYYYHNHAATTQQSFHYATVEGQGYGTTTPPHYVILCEEKAEQQQQRNPQPDERRDENDQSQRKLRGVLVWYFGYSTWKGKVMNVDCILFDTVEVEKMLILCVVEIAKKLDLGRIVYQIEGMNNAETMAQKYNFDILNEWLTLQMTKDSMSSFLDTINTWDIQLSLSVIKSTKNQDSRIVNQESSATILTNNLTIIDIYNRINGILSFMNPAMYRRKTNLGGRFRLRYAFSEDAKSILNLVQGLAIYEKALDEVEVNESIYQIDGSGDNPLYHCILLERLNGSSSHDNDNDDDHDDATADVVGMGCFYFGHKTVISSSNNSDTSKSIVNNKNKNNKNNSERFLFLEDLFIQKEYRGNGFGKAIMYTLALISTNLNCNRFVWQALDWNDPALKFYSSIGANVCQGLMTLRLDKKRIQEFEV